MTTTATIEYVITGPDGHERCRGEKICESFVENFHAILFSTINGADVSIIDTTGNPRLIKFTGIFTTKSSSDIDTYGILVGDGNAPMRSDDYTLDHLIPSGTADGCLQYNVTSDATVAIENDSVVLSIRRVMSNYTTSVRTIREIGLCANVMHGFDEVYILLLRDIFESDIIMMPFENIALKIKIKTSL